MAPCCYHERKDLAQATDAAIQSWMTKNLTSGILSNILVLKRIFFMISYENSTIQNDVNIFLIIEDDVT